MNRVVMCLILIHAGLAWATDENTLRDAFGSFGTVTDGVFVFPIFSFECYSFSKLGGLHLVTFAIDFTILGTLLAVNVGTSCL